MYTLQSSEFERITHLDFREFDITLDIDNWVGSS